MSKWSRNADAYSYRVDASRERHRSEPRTYKVVVKEADGRFLITFDYTDAAVKLVKSLPGARWSWDSYCWSVSIRYRKRVETVVHEIQLIEDEARVDDLNKAANEAAATAAINELFETDAKHNPLTEPTGWRCYAAGGRWAIASPYDAQIVRRFKSVRGSKWNGSVWTFPAGARSDLEAIINDVHGAIS